LFDLDKDGILNFKEYEKLLKCLGYRLSGEKNCIFTRTIGFHTLQTDQENLMGRLRLLRDGSGH